MADDAAMFSFITSWALGWIAGTALQLQQTELWAVWAYLSLVIGLLALWRGLSKTVGQELTWCVLACACALAFA